MSDKNKTHDNNSEPKNNTKSNEYKSENKYQENNKSKSFLIKFTKQNPAIITTILSVFVIVFISFWKDI